MKVDVDMRRLVATVCLLLLLASCGRGVGRAVGTTIGLTGGAAVLAGGTGMAVGFGSGDPYGGAVLGASGLKLTAIGLAMFIAGGIIIRAENIAPIVPREPPPRQAPPMPRLSSDDPRRTGVWREVPSVYGDDGE